MQNTPNIFSSPNDATKEEYKVISEKLDKVNLDDSHRSLEEQTSSKLPAGVVDFDKENWNDPLQVSRYAMDIFNYLKSREVSYMMHHAIFLAVHVWVCSHDCFSKYYVAIGICVLSRGFAIVNFGFSLLFSINQACVLSKIISIPNFSQFDSLVVT